MGHHIIDGSSVRKLTVMEFHFAVLILFREVG